MPITLRVVLLVGAILTLAYFVVQIRRRRLQIDYAIFWCLFSVLLVLASIFPDAIVWLSDALGFMSPANLVFLVIIFLLILRLFSATIKLSRLNHQVEDLTQRLAIHEMEHSKNKD